jgi:hypothetical protein
MLRQARLARGHVIASVGGVPTPDLASFIEIMRNTTHGEQLTIKFYDLAERTHVQLTSLTVDRKWFQIADTVRGDPRLSESTWQTHTLPHNADSAGAAAGPAAAAPTASTADTADTADTATTPYAQDGALLWKPSAAPYAQDGALLWKPSADGVWRAEAPPKTAPTPAALGTSTGDASGGGDSSSSSTSSSSTSTSTSTSSSSTGDGKTQGEPSVVPSVSSILAPSLVTVDFTRPFSIDGETGMRYRGAGLVLDAAQGLVAVDRNTVTSTLGDVIVTVGGNSAGAAAVPARVVFVHPMHNFALVQYDPAALPRRARATSARLAMDTRTMSTGTSAWLVGLKSGLNEEFDASRRVELVARKTKVANSGWIKLPLPNPPRYQVRPSE